MNSNLMLLSILLAIENEEESNAVQEIYRLYYTKMVLQAYQVLNNDQDAEDAAMNVLKKISSKPYNFLDYKTTRTKSTIIYMVKDEAIDIYRKNAKDGTHVVSADIVEEIPATDKYNELECMALSEENRKLLKKAIDELDDKYRSPIIMSTYGRMSNIEIAEALGKNRNEVDTLLFRARKKIKEKLSKEMITL